MLKLIVALFISLPLYSQTAKKEALSSWAARDVKASLEEALQKFEVAHAEDPSDLETIVYLIRGTFFLADAHTVDNQQLKKLLDKGRDIGMAALKSNPEFKKLLDKGEDVEDAVKVLTEREVEVTYWTAVSIGRWAKANGILSSIRVKGQILAMIENVEKNRPDYFYGAVPRYWGSYYAIIPRIAGKDLKKSHKYFEESIKAAPDFLGTKILMAEIYCVEKDDKKLFKKLLHEVLAAENTNPELIPENNIEKKKAQALLDKMDKLF